MNNNYAFYNWFQKIISIFIDIFFVAAPIATVYVFTSPFVGVTRYTIFALLIIIYLLVVFFLKEKVKSIIALLLNKIERVDEKKLILIIFVVMFVLKAVYTILFNYDATSDGDIEIYNQIADSIVSTGKIESNAISHLYGVGLHFALFKLLSLPLHIGLFVVILIGTLSNYLSFKRIVGKEKAFLTVLLYIIMPSTTMMSFCPTHEVFVYMYISVFLLAFTSMLRNDSLLKEMLYGLVCVASVVLTCLVNPGGYIVCVILVLCLLLTDIRIKDKVVIVVMLVLILLGNSGISKLLNVNEFNTTQNTYTILIHGSNPNSLGEQVDGYPLKQMRMYIHAYTNDFSKEGFNEAAQHVLIGQYKFLLAHPTTLVKLVLHKIYILWSGVHYPLELAFHNNAYSTITNYILLVINTLVYLFVITLRSVYKRIDKDRIEISVYKLELLGIIALTMLCIVANKYALYATIFIYLISFYSVRRESE